MTQSPSLILIFGVCLLLTGCGKSDAPPHSNPTNSSTASKLTIEPVQTFAQSCARCHGPEGMFYAIPFKHQGDDLRNIVRSMMAENAQLKPTEADVDAMLEYHLQIRDKMQSKSQ